MKKIVIIIYIVLSVAEFNFPQNWFPLEVGNHWQYKYSEVGWVLQPTQLRYIGINLSELIITKDSLINGVRYFYYQKNAPLNNSGWIRYSQQDNKIYIWWDNEDKVYMNFNLNDGDTLISFNEYFKTIIGTNIISGTASLFSNSIFFKGYKQYIQIPGGIFDLEDHFTNDIGWFYFYYENWHNPHYPCFYSDNYQDLIQAVLYDSLGNEQVLTNNYKPEINLVPKHTIHSNYFSLSFSIDHYYNIDPYDICEGFTFIDNVLMESYYSKEDSVINLPVKTQNGSLNGNYNFVQILDTLIMRNGFVFNYKIIAKDKGIIPETSFSPDSSYYQCFWDGETGINDDNKYPTITFSLEQNYPNPFNPSTKISWHSPVGSWQTLKVYDILGNEVVTLVNEYKNTGSYNIEFNASHLASGIYYYQLRAGNYVETKKMILMK